MGLLKDFGAVLSYEDAKKLQQQLQNMAAMQFLHLLEKYQLWERDQGPNSTFLWGD